MVLKTSLTSDTLPAAGSGGRVDIRFRAVREKFGKEFLAKKEHLLWPREAQTNTYFIFRVWAGLTVDPAERRGDL